MITLSFLAYKSYMAQTKQIFLLALFLMLPLIVYVKDILAHKVGLAVNHTTTLTVTIIKSQD